MDLDPMITQAPLASRTAEFGLWKRVATITALAGTLGLAACGGGGEGDALHAKPDEATTTTMEEVPSVDCGGTINLDLGWENINGNAANADALLGSYFEGGEIVSTPRAISLTQEAIRGSWNVAGTFDLLKRLRDQEIDIAELNETSIRESIEHFRTLPQEELIARTEELCTMAALLENADEIDAMPNGFTTSGTATVLSVDRAPSTPGELGPVDTINLNTKASETHLPGFVFDVVGDGASYSDEVNFRNTVLITVDGHVIFNGIAINVSIDVSPEESETPAGSDTSSSIESTPGQETQDSQGGVTGSSGQEAGAEDGGASSDQGDQGDDGGRPHGDDEGCTGTGSPECNGTGNTPGGPGAPGAPEGETPEEEGPDVPTGTTTPVTPGSTTPPTTGAPTTTTGAPTTTTGSTQPAPTTTTGSTQPAPTTTTEDDDKGSEHTVPVDCDGNPFDTRCE